MPNAMFSFELPHTEYAKRLIRAKVGRAETVSVRDCYDLMLTFAAEEIKLADAYKNLAEMAKAVEPPAPFILQGITQIGSK